MSGEILAIVTELNPKHIIDCTFGAGGHASLLLNAGYQVTSFDQDPTALFHAQKLNSYSKFRFISDQFSNIDKYNLGADLILADLGMSTMQIRNQNGFSFMQNSRLEMKMSGKPPFLYEILSSMPKYKIMDILQQYGEEPKARQIATNIDNYRLHSKIETTFDLRDATGVSNFSTLARVFQAFRIYINEEMKELDTLIQFIFHDKINALILSFHSLEDRRVKECAKQAPYSKLYLPSQAEIDINPASRSAKLRYISW